MSSFFRTVLVRDEVASTSDLARELVKSSEVALPLVVHARKQTRGRGRGEHRWWSDEGSLTFTIAIDPCSHGLRRDHEPKLALAVAVGMIELGEAMGSSVPLQVRWPNDVEAGGLKLAGILPERIETAFGPRVLIGVGLNVATRFASAPSEVRGMAISLRDLCGRELEIPAVLEAFLERFPALLARLVRDDPGLAEAWSDRDSLTGKSIQLKVGTEILVGRGGGITRTGGLILVRDGGTSVHHGGQVLRTNS